MQPSKLAKWIERGYPHLKEASDLPAWFLPERSFAGVITELGGERIVELARPLGLREGLGELIDKAPDPASLPEEVWQAGALAWPPLREVSSVTEACLEASVELRRHFMGRHEESCGYQIEPAEVYSGLMVIAFAPFHAEGEPLLAQLATILGGDRSGPAEMLKRYASAVVNSDIITIKQVSRCLAQSGRWLEWARGLLNVAGELSYMPRLIAVTPPPSPELIGVLADIVKEMRDDDLSRDHRKDTAEQGDT
jgi:hypothetical protein